VGAKRKYTSDGVGPVQKKIHWARGRVSNQRHTIGGWRGTKNTLAPLTTPTPTLGVGFLHKNTLGLIDIISYDMPPCTRVGKAKKIAN